MAGDPGMARHLFPNNYFDTSQTYSSSSFSSRCSDCGKPYYYIGDVVGDISFLICTCKKKNFFHNFQQGWVCPLCGQANSPYLDNCNCQRKSLKITFICE